MNPTLLSSPSTREKSRHIVWKPEEVKQVAEAVRWVVAHDKSIRLLTAIHQAEDVLPVERRRKKPFAMYREAGVVFKAAYAEGLNITPEELAKIPSPVFKLANTNGQPPSRGISPFEAYPASQAETPAPPSDDLTEDSEPEARPADPWGLFAQLVVEVGHDLVERLDRIESALIARIGPPPGWKPPESVRAPKTKAKRIAIVGLLKDQFEHVRSKVAHLPFTLVWLDKDDAHVRIPQCDFLLVQRHCSHKWFQKAGHLLGCEASFVDGGITQVTQKVLDIHSRRVGP